MSNINSVRFSRAVIPSTIPKSTGGILSSLSKWFGCLCGADSECDSSSAIILKKEDSNEEGFKGDIRKLNMFVANIDAELELVYYYKVGGPSYENNRRQNIQTKIKELEAFSLEVCKKLAFNNNSKQNKLFVSVINKISKINAKIIDKMLTVDKKLEYSVVNISYILCKIQFAIELPLDLQVEIQVQYLRDLCCRFEREEVSPIYHEKISIKLKELWKKYNYYTDSENSLFKYMSKINEFLGEYKVPCLLQSVVNGYNFSFSGYV